MRNSILLCGGGEDAAAAAEWAEEQARGLRLTRRAARSYGERVKAAYEAACQVLPGTAGENPVIKISVEPSGLTPRFDFVNTASPAARKSPRAIRALRIIEKRKERAARRALGGDQAG